MSERDTHPVRAEVLPPLHRQIVSVPDVSQLPQGAFGISLFARARYASEEKQVEAYRRLVVAKNALAGALVEQVNLIIAYTKLSEEARNLDSLRAIARLGIAAQLRAIEQEAKLSVLRFETEEARLLYERDRLRKAREDLNAPRKTALQPESIADQLKGVGAEIEDIERGYEEVRLQMITRAGGEEHLSEEEKRRLGQFALLREKLLHDVMADLL